MVTQLTHTVAYNVKKNPQPKKNIKSHHYYSWQQQYNQINHLRDSLIIHGPQAC